MSENLKLTVLRGACAPALNLKFVKPDPMVEAIQRLIVTYPGWYKQWREHQLPQLTNTWSNTWFGTNTALPPVTYQQVPTVIS